MRKLISLFFIPILFCTARAQEVIVEASRINQEKIEPSRSANVIQLDQQTKTPTVADLLRKIPGVEVVRQGGAGQTTSVFIRGARSEDTLVLIDGVEVNDVLSPGRGFDFSTLPAEGIERIEVYRGPQSVRFGAGALGGVINIISKEGKEKSQVSYFAELGSYQTSTSSLVASGKNKDVSYAVTAQHFLTQGFSAAAKESGNTEADSAEVSSASMKLGWTPTRTAKLESTVRYIDAALDLDTQGGSGGDDPNNRSKSKQLTVGVLGSERFFEDQLKTSLGFYFSEVSRKNRNPSDIVNADDSSDSFLSENRKIKSESELLLGEFHTLKWILSYQDEGGLSNSLFNGTQTLIPRKNQSIAGLSATYLFEGPIWFFDMGLRADQSSQVNSIMSYRTSVGRFFSDRQTKFFISYGTGYKLPSLYQRYSSYGDQNLKSENSTTLEATFEKEFFSFTVFENQFRDLIDYNTVTTRYFNLLKANSRGGELQATISLSNIVFISGRYTYLESEDKSTGLRLLRRPQNSGMLSVGVLKENYQLDLQYTYRGTRDDTDSNSFERIKMRDYSLVGLDGSYQFDQRLKLHARIENIFDQKYSEVAGYGTAGRSLYVGISGSFE